MAGLAWLWKLMATTTSKAGTYPSTVLRQQRQQRIKDTPALPGSHIMRQCANTGKELKRGAGNEVSGFTSPRCSVTSWSMEQIPATDVVVGLCGDK